MMDDNLEFSQGAHNRGYFVYFVLALQLLSIKFLKIEFENIMGFDFEDHQE